MAALTFTRFDQQYAPAQLRCEQAKAKGSAPGGSQGARTLAGEAAATDAANGVASAYFGAFSLRLKAKTPDSPEVAIQLYIIYVIIYYIRHVGGLDPSLFSQ